MDLRGTKLSWNWGAFLFSPYWFFYRKLYWLGGIFLGLTLAMAIFFAGPMLEIQHIYNSLPTQAMTQADISSFQAQLGPYMNYIFALLAFTLITHSAAAFLANSVYKKKVSAEVKSIRRFAKDENVFRMLTIRRGGTSSFALLGSILLYDLIWYLVNQIVQSM